MRTLLLGSLLVGCGLLCQIVSSVKSPQDNLEDSEGVSEEVNQDMEAFVGKRDAGMSSADMIEQPSAEMTRHKRSHSRSHSRSRSRFRVRSSSMSRTAKRRHFTNLVKKVLLSRKTTANDRIQFKNHLFRYKNRRPRPRPRPRPKTTPKPTSPTKPPCIYQNTVTCGEKEKRYRTTSGECNNLANQLFGRSGTPFRRFLPADYSGPNKDKPRKAASGKALQSARLVSRELIKKTEPFIPSETGASMIFVTIGQLLTHDITKTEEALNHDDEDSVCHTADCRGHPACSPISVPPNDPSKSFKNRTCISFVRSKAGPTLDCKSDSGQQINGATSYIDCSFVYGSTPEKNTQLRENGGKGAKLLMRENTNNSKLKKLLPRWKDTLSLTGDPRADAHVSLAAFHTLFTREHNRLVDKLREINGKLSEEELYQRARKILIACFQHIIYNEYLPILFGNFIDTEPGLQPEKTGYSNTYDKDKDPSILNVVATVFMRYGHSIVPSRLILFNNKGQIPKIGTLPPIPYFTSMVFFNSKLLSPAINGSCDFFMNGGYIHQAYKIDIHMTDQLTEHLRAYAHSTKPSDLASLNIARGREHGITGYASWREAAGESVPTSFEDLVAIFKDQAIVNKLKILYENVIDIDPYVGMLLEPHNGTSLVGDTAKFFLAKQFKCLRAGDRFWYENPPVHGHTFTPAQLTEIRKITLAKLICNNMDSITQIIKNPLKVGFDKMDCKDIADIDLTPFAA